MAHLSFSLPDNYWQSLVVDPKDIDALNTYLFEKETPLSITELTAVLVEMRLNTERSAQALKDQGSGELYRPAGEYHIGQKLIFPLFANKQGKVISIRAGSNPNIASFDVLDIAFEDGSTKQFAARLADHKLNEAKDEAADDGMSPAAIMNQYGADLEKKLAEVLKTEDSLVRIARRYFPQALLVDITQGHLNLAEAVLEVANGEPMTAHTLSQQIDLPHTDNPSLVEFALNYALQEDPEGRFDEVGPAGQVLWVLKRQEPADVLNVPAALRYTEIDHDRGVLNDQMLKLESELDDEWSWSDRSDTGNEASISLIYPHWRAGTLPLSPRIRKFFPTAYESPRVRFNIVDAKSGEKIPAWVVREDGYVYGLKNWYKKQNLIPGAYIIVRKSKNPGEVILEAKTRRATKDWVRTVMAGSDGGLVYAVLRQEVACEYNERMAVIIQNVEAIDAAADKVSKSHVSLEKLIADSLRELSKLTPQGHVHAQELYSAINLLRRVPPAPLMAILAKSEVFQHIGDLHYRLAEVQAEE